MNNNKFSVGGLIFCILGGAAMKNATGKMTELLGKIQKS